MSAAWNTIEDALRAWVLSATGYDESQVIWAEQSGSRPLGNFITLRLGTIVPLGAVDETRQTENLSRVGEELEISVVGVREFVVTLQAFHAEVTGFSTARNALSKCQTALSLSTVRDALALAGVTPFDAGTVQNITGLQRDSFESRAVLEVRFYTCEDASERVTYIETVETTSYLGPPDSGTAEEIDI